MKWRHFLYTGLVAWVVLGACTSNDKQSAEEKREDDSLALATPDTAFATETVHVFNTTGFSAYAKQRLKEFDWANFRMTNSWTDDSLITASYSPDKNYYDAYGKFIKYSPDSTYFIDLDSYNVDIKKDISGKLVGHEVGPDTEVSLVNIKTAQKTRLLFLGPGNSVEDGLWLDNDNLALMGVKDHGNGAGKTAAVWRYNIPTKTFYLYELQNAGAQELMGYWKKERLRGILTNNQ